jgi:hypothetical protein
MAERVGERGTNKEKGERGGAMCRHVCTTDVVFHISVIKLKDKPYIDPYVCIFVEN